MDRLTTRQFRPGLFLIFIVALATVLVTGCSRDTVGAASAPRDATGSSAIEDGDGARPALRVAEQHGLAYAPLALIQAEDRLAGTIDVEWIRVNNAAAIREAMLARRLDIGFMGIPPYLIGRDRETGWHAFTGLSRAPLGLVTVNPQITDLFDLVTGDRGHRIALPQPGSIQHILLSMALDRAHGDPTLLDNRLVSMGHPDGMSALLAAGTGGDIAAHFTSPPFLFEELRHPDARLLLSGREAFGGEFTFIVGVLAPDVPPESPAVAALTGALDEAMTEIASLQDELRAADPDELPRDAAGTLTTLATFYQISAGDLGGYLRQEGLIYEREIRGMERFSERMRAFGYLSRAADGGADPASQETASDTAGPTP
jgi:NitT/TauT family transport system substrate-binding protein